MGLVVEFDERNGVTWPIDPATGIGVRSSPRRSRQGNRDLRAVPCAAGAAEGRLRAGAFARHDGAGGAARAGAVLARRPDARRGLQLRAVPAEQDVPQGRHLQRLPRSAHAAAARAGRAGVPRVPREGEIRGSAARSSPGGHAAGRLRELSHAAADLHGHRCAPRPQLPGAAAGADGAVRRAQHLQPVPPGAVGAVGRGPGGEVVRACAGGLPALRRGALRLGACTCRARWRGSRGLRATRCSRRSRGPRR